MEKGRTKQSANFTHGSGINSIIPYLDLAFRKRLKKFL